MEVVRLFMGGLAPQTTESELRLKLGNFGTVDKLEIVKDATTGAAKGFGYADFIPKDDKSLTMCLTTLNRTKWRGSEFRIEKAKEHYTTRMEREKKQVEEWQQSQTKDTEAPDEVVFDPTRHPDMWVQGKGHRWIAKMNISWQRNIKSLDIETEGISEKRRRERQDAEGKKKMKKEETLNADDVVHHASTEEMQVETPELKEVEEREEEEEEKADEVEEEEEQEAEAEEEVEVEEEEEVEVEEEEEVEAEEEEEEAEVEEEEEEVEAEEEREEEEEETSESNDNIQEGEIEIEEEEEEKTIETKEDIRVKREEATQEKSTPDSSDDLLLNFDTSAKPAVVKKAIQTPKKTNDRTKEKKREDKREDKRQVKREDKREEEELPKPSPSNAEVARLLMAKLGGKKKPTATKSSPQKPQATFSFNFM
ncbi:hypothetical protein PROFUN_07384 [Planoprotostelium fungivorum]|uniref:RRM domain-containing protein n=1 Tax=Planoprotostelium fungivorum TaxID=1890364 RepID=A0A2P6MTF9_9EUKA|nr:hypothetical protein PROFUN_07384 [Planoprotostelium fungivorum]